MGKSTTKNCWL